MDKTTYEKTLRSQQRSGATRPACIRCGEDNPIVLEDHHVFGRGYSDDVVPLCKNCHAKITAGQNLVSPAMRSKNASAFQRLIYALLTFFLLLAQCMENLIKICYELLAAGSA